MPYFHQMEPISTSRDMVSEFKGYNHNFRIGEGEWYQDKNLTTDYYPIMAPRAPRGVGSRLNHPNGALAKDALAFVDGTVLYYNHLPVAGLVLSNSEKTMISMGAYIVIFPDKVLYNTVDGTVEYMEAEFQSTGDTTFTICRVDGADYDYELSDEEPPAPENGDYWLDTSGVNHILKQYSEASSMWVQIATTYIRIESTGIGEAFAQWDGVRISGCKHSDDGSTVANQINALNTVSYIVSKSANYIVVTGMLDQAYTQTDPVTVERRVPDMDFVTESENRLWGCKYGMVDGKTVNEIYACALGDPKNWNVFRGISTDSYAVTLGSDGCFTGAITYLGYPLFFKEKCVHKIYGTMPSNYQLQTTNMRGVQRECSKSLKIVDERLYYKSPVDVCVYTGSLPDTVSADLGNVPYKNATAGAIGGKYYISMQDEEDAWHLFCFDTRYRMWHEEDGVEARYFANVDTDLYYVDMTDKTLKTIAGNSDETVEWYAESGIMGFSSPDNKYCGRINLRMMLPAGSSVRFFVEYDSSGVWESKGDMEGSSLRTFAIPLIPRRCDHFRFRLEGKGPIRLYSITKVTEDGSDM